MELERYYQQFDERVSRIEEEAEARLHAFRQKCLSNYIAKLRRHQDEWDSTFRDILNKSQEETPELRKLRNVSFAEKPQVKLIENCLSILDESISPPASQTPKPAHTLLLDQDKNTIPESIAGLAQSPPDARGGDTVDNARLISSNNPLKAKSKSNKDEDEDEDDAYTIEHRDYFTNNLAVKEFIRIQELQEQNRQLLHEFSNNPALKPFKNEMNLFIRTQINSISNSSNEHLRTKIRSLVSLFRGENVSFQDKLISASKHPQGILFAMDIAAQTFVTVGTRLVNSVPAIAKSMAFVVIGIVKSNLPVFKDLVIGHLQERCPYIIPMYPRLSDLTAKQGSIQPTQAQQKTAQTQYLIACGYSYDPKTQQLESEEKYLSRMRSMALIYACILALQDNAGPMWSWLASFLSIKPQPVITPTILQAYLQETSKSLLSVYRGQFRKLLDFIRSDYIAMIEKVTKKPQDRQPLIKLKNQLCEIS